VKAEEELTPMEARRYNSPMDPLTRFLTLLISLLVFFLALFLLTGVYLVRPGRFQLIVKKGHYWKSLKPGLYFFFPFFYEGFGQYLEGKGTYRIRLSHQRIFFSGSLLDPERFCAGKKSYRAWIKKAVKENLDPKLLSLQIEAILEQNGWQIDSVFIER
jgi:hypothetical protein